MPLMMVADEKPAADVAAVAAGSVLTLLSELENAVTETRNTAAARAFMM